VWYLIRELPYLKEKNDKLLKKIAQLDQKIGLKHAQSRPLCAFVTFNTQDAVIQTLTAYRCDSTPRSLRSGGVCDCVYAHAAGSPSGTTSSCPRSCASRATASAYVHR
jgi:hypothetical protein